MLSKRSIQKVYGVLSVIPRGKECKEELVSSYTDGRTTRVSEMSEEEAKTMIIKTLRQLTTEQLNAGKISRDKMMKKVVAIMYALRWTVNGKADYNRLENWSIDRFQKSYKTMSNEELRTLLLNGLIRMEKQVFH